MKRHKKHKHGKKAASERKPAQPVPIPDATKTLPLTRNAFSRICIFLVAFLKEDIKKAGVFGIIITILLSPLFFPSTHVSHDDTTPLLELALKLDPEQSVPLDVLRSLVHGLDDSAYAQDRETLMKTLRDNIEEYKTLRENLARLSNDDPEIRRLHGRASDALDHGRFGEAEDILGTSGFRRDGAARQT